MVKTLPAVQEMQELRSVPGGEDPLEKEWQPTPIFLPGEFHGQRSLAVYHAWDDKELDAAEWLTQLYCWKSHVIIFFFSIRSATGDWIQFPVPYNRTLFIHSTCNSLHLLTPKSISSQALPLDKHSIPRPNSLRYSWWSLKRKDCPFYFQTLNLLFCIRVQPMNSVVVVSGG